MDSFCADMLKNKDEMMIMEWDCGSYRMLINHCCNYFYFLCRLGDIKTMRACYFQDWGEKAKDTADLFTANPTEIGPLYLWKSFVSLKTSADPNHQNRDELDDPNFTRICKPIFYKRTSYPSITRPFIETW